MIVPQAEVAGVHLLMSETGVRHVLGRPKSMRSVKDGLGPTRPIRVMDYGKTKVYLSATADGTVFDVTTTDRRQKTKSGVGVGSSERAVKRGVAHVTCTGPRTLRSCTVGRLLAGQRVTTFRLSHDRVRQITLGFVID
ncbi:hypothetical protein DSM104299_05577 [Baekduia alba]|uniref:hypothetical protein n=1 Tax=Baekduia alba TaxID=2997333 RepID=UPI002340A234|nr:hypothetical protein [Baekduia alba]WCB96809.1 hypothetical protein DSM104299_05577 [Baekduia alba]